MKIFFQFFFPILIFLGSCDPNRIYEKNVDISDRMWNKDSTIRFDFEIEDINTSYHLYYNLRNTLLYPFQNIYLDYRLLDDYGNLIGNGLSQYDLFDPVSGKPLGDGLGDIFDHRFPIELQFRFKNPGLYHLEITQYMRIDPLPEIMSVGLRIDKAPPQE